MRRISLFAVVLGLVGGMGSTGGVLAACSSTEGESSASAPNGDASSADAASTSTANDAASDALVDGAVGVPPPTLDDFWDRKAYFVQSSIFQNGSDGKVGFSAYNVNQSVVVKDGVWYVFAREFVAPQPVYCPADSTRTIVKSSTDHGKTWSADTTIVDQIPNTPTECNALDGDIFYDAPSNTWHFLYQCMDRSLKWNICHSSHVGATPEARFVDDAANPVVRNGDLWKLILGAGTVVHDDGTPEIVAKDGDYYYVTFHGIDDKSPIDLMRGLARTKDFVHWEAVGTAPIYTKADCQGWNVPWQAPGCYGGGASGTQRLGSNYYMVMESSDLSGGCVVDQDWVFGMLRSPTVSGPWTNMTDPAIVFSTFEKQADGHRPACALGYPQLFVDETGVEHLLLYRGGSVAPVDLDPAHGHYLYELRRDAPVALYTFREGPSHVYTQSDVVSRGNQQASTANVTWIADAADDTNSLGFNGTDSVVTVVTDGPAFALSTYARLELHGSIDAAPTAKSAFVAGKLLSYWFEQYPNGTLCFETMLASGDGGAPTTASACFNVAADYGTKHAYAGEFDGKIVRVLRDGVEVQRNAAIGTLAPSTFHFAIGSGGQNAAGFYQSIKGTIDDVKLYDKP